MYVESLLPSIVIIISTGAGLVYAFCGDFGRALYWFAAALINASATWFIR